MAKETSMGLALKAAVGTLSRKKQTELIAEYIYKKYEVFNRFKPLAVGIDQDLIKAMPQYDATLILRVLSNHCRRPRYIKALAKGGKRFNLNNRFKGEITAEEQAIAQKHPSLQTANPSATENNATENVANENNETPVEPAE